MCFLGGANRVAHRERAMKGAGLRSGRVSIFACMRRWRRSTENDAKVQPRKCGSQHLFESQEDNRISRYDENERGSSPPILPCFSLQEMVAAWRGVLHFAIAAKPILTLF